MVGGEHPLCHCHATSLFCNRNQDNKAPLLCVAKRWGGEGSREKRIKENNNDLVCCILIEFLFFAKKKPRCNGGVLLGECGSKIVIQSSFVANMFCANKGFVCVPKIKKLPLRLFWSGEIRKGGVWMRYR